MLRRTHRRHHEPNFLSIISLFASLPMLHSKRQNSVHQNYLRPRRWVTRIKNKTLVLNLFGGCLVKERDDGEGGKDRYGNGDRSRTWEKIRVIHQSHPSDNSTAQLHFLPAIRRRTEAGRDGSARTGAKEINLKAPGTSLSQSRKLLSGCRHGDF